MGRADVPRNPYLLTVLGYMLEYHFGVHPRVYHLANLLLHLAVTTWVFLLAWKMGASLDKEAVLRCCLASIRED